MELRRLGSRLFQVALVVLVVALLAGQVLGQPVLLGFVTTGSMEPAIDAGDGFVALPPDLTGVEEGDVVTFEAEAVGDGELTTHRIVDETDQGYVTRGDANPFTDQDDGEPYVRESDVEAVAWQPGGSVLTIPWLGSFAGTVQSGLSWLQVQLAGLFGTDALLGTQGIAWLLFAASVVLYGLSVWLEPARRRERSVGRSLGTNPRLLVAGLALVLVAGATAAMVVPADTQEFGIVSAEFESDSPDVVERGTNESYDYPVHNTGLVSTVVVFESHSDRLEAQPDAMRVGSQSSENATVTVTAPEETGHYHADLSERRYLRLLPTSVIERLHDVHPWLALGAVNAVIAVPFYLVGMWLLGTGRLRSRDRGSHR